MDAPFIKNTVVLAHRWDLIQTFPLTEVFGLVQRVFGRDPQVLRDELRSALAREVAQWLGQGAPVRVCWDGAQELFGLELVLEPGQRRLEFGPGVCLEVDWDGEQVSLVEQLVEVVAAQQAPSMAAMPLEQARLRVPDCRVGQTLRLPVCKGQAVVGMVYQQLPYRLWRGALAESAFVFGASERFARVHDALLAAWLPWEPFAEGSVGAVLERAPQWLVGARWEMPGDAFALTIEAVHLRRTMERGAPHQAQGADWQILASVDGALEPLPRVEGERLPVPMVEYGFVLRIERGLHVHRAFVGRSVGLVEAAAALSAVAEPDAERAAQRIGSALQSLGRDIKSKGVDGDRALKTLMGALGDDTARGGPWGEASVATLWRMSLTQKDIDEGNFFPTVCPEPKGRVGSIASWALSPDGQRVALGSASEVTVVDLVQDRVVDTHRICDHGGNDWIIRCAFAAKAKVLGVATQTGTVLRFGGRFHAIETGMSGDRDASLALSTDGSRGALAVNNQRTAWLRRHFNAVAVFDKHGVTHRFVLEAQSQVRALWWQDEGALLHILAGTSLYVWALETQAQPRLVRERVLAFRPDVERLWCLDDGADAGRFMLAETLFVNPLDPHDQGFRPAGPQTALQWSHTRFDISPQGDVLAISHRSPATGQPVVSAVNVETGLVRHWAALKWCGDGWGVDSASLRVVQHGYAMTVFDVLSGQSTTVSCLGNNEGSLRAWFDDDGGVSAMVWHGNAGAALLDMKAGKPLRLLERSDGLGIEEWTLSADKRIAVALLYDGTICAWDLASGRRLSRFYSFPAFHPHFSARPVFALDAHGAWIAGLDRQISLGPLIEHPDTHTRLFPESEVESMKEAMEELEDDAETWVEFAGFWDEEASSYNEISPWGDGDWLTVPPSLWVDPEGQWLLYHDPLDPKALKRVRSGHQTPDEVVFCCDEPMQSVSLDQTLRRAAMCLGDRVQVVDLHSKQTLWMHATVLSGVSAQPHQVIRHRGAIPRMEVRFSASGNHVLVFTWPGRARHVSVFEAETGALCWTLVLGDSWERFGIDINADATVLLLRGGQAAIVYERSAHGRWMRTHDFLALEGLHWAMWTAKGVIQSIGSEKLMSWSNMPYDMMWLPEPEQLHTRWFEPGSVRQYVEQARRDDRRPSLSPRLQAGVGLDGLDLSETWMEWADLRGASLRGVSLKQAWMAQSDLRGAALQGALMEHVDLRGANLAGADLRGVDLRQARLDSADLRGADLRGADLRGAELIGVRWEGAQLAGARFDPDSAPL